MCRPWCVSRLQERSVFVPYERPRVWRLRAARQRRSDPSLLAVPALRPCATKASWWPDDRAHDPPRPDFRFRQDRPYRVRARARGPRRSADLDRGHGEVALRDAGLDVTEVSAVTGFPEIMDGRVKTLHPKIHGGLLAERDEPGHAEAMRAHGIEGIDLLVVNLYPFDATVARGADFETVVENIDIGGPAMIRAAAKNHDWVTVVVDPEDYQPVLAEMAATKGKVRAETRRKLAQTAFARTAAYDANVSNWLQGQLAKAGDAAPPRRRSLRGHAAQRAALRREPASGRRLLCRRRRRATASRRPSRCRARSSPTTTSPTPMRPTSWWRSSARSNPPAPSSSTPIPCGVAVGSSLADAYRRALECDPVSAFGGVLAFNATLDGATAEEIAKLFTEVIIAPDADEDARRVLAAKKNLRLLIAGGLPDARAAGLTFRSVAGGMLVQTRDDAIAARARSQDRHQAQAHRARDRRHAVRAQRGEARQIERDRLCPRWRDRRHRRRPDEPRRRRADGGHESARRRPKPRAGRNPRPRARPPRPKPSFRSRTVCSAVAEAGATAVIQPGGSVKDDEVIAAADELGIAMVVHRHPPLPPLTICSLIFPGRRGTLAVPPGVFSPRGDWRG